MEEEEVVVIVVKGGGSYASHVGMEGRVRPVPMGDVPGRHFRVANLGGGRDEVPPPAAAARRARDPGGDGGLRPSRPIVRYPEHYA